MKSKAPENADHKGRQSHRPKIGVALSSGASKGLSHVGVIQILEENGIEVDAIAGSSMGAYVGSLWASGRNGEELEEIALAIRSRWQVLKMIDPAFPPRRGFIHGHRIRKYLERFLGDSRFEDLPTALSVVATELATGRARIFEEGQLSTRVHASFAIPGSVHPVTIDGVEYADGGISNPLPVDVLRAAGMDIVIAVSVVPTIEELAEQAEALAKEPPKKRGLFLRGLGFLNRHLNYFAKDNLLDILIRSALVPQMKLAELSQRNADLVIRPQIEEKGFHDYHEGPKYIVAGRAAAKPKIDRLKELLKRHRFSKRPGDHASISL